MYIPAEAEIVIVPMAKGTDWRLLQPAGVTGAADAAWEAPAAPLQMRYDTEPDSVTGTTVDTSTFLK
jgi:hypothetical protein